MPGCRDRSRSGVKIRFGPPGQRVQTPTPLAWPAAGNVYDGNNYRGNVQTKYTCLLNFNEFYIFAIKSVDSDKSW